MLKAKAMALEYIDLNCKPLSEGEYRVFDHLIYNVATKRLPQYGNGHVDRRMIADYFRSTENPWKAHQHQLIKEGRWVVDNVSPQVLINYNSDTHSSFFIAKNNPADLELRHFFWPADLELQILKPADLELQRKKPANLDIIF